MSVRKPYSFKHWLQYVFVRILFIPVQVLPLSICLPAACLIGRLFFHLLPSHKKIALDNAKRAFGDSMDERARYKMVQGSYENIAMNIIELIQFPRIMKIKDLEKKVLGEVNNDVLQRALKVYNKGRGILFITAHLGNWEMNSILLRRAGMPFTAVARPLPNGYIDDYLTAQRESCGQRIVKKRGALKQMMAELKEGGTLGFLIDQNARKHGVIVKFFDQEASTIPSVASISQKLNIPVLAGACFRVGNRFRFRLEILPQMELVNTGNRREDLVTNTQIMTDAIEQLVRLEPKQWLWAHQRWRIKDSWRSKGRLAGHVSPPTKD